MKNTFFLTTAIDYTNGAPHIGHAYEKVLADVIARYHRLKGEKVFFLTGVDQHGQKVQQSAQKEGVSPQEFSERNTQKFLALWKKLDVQYDAWAATTADLHKRAVQGVLQRLHDEGQLYKKGYKGFYSVRQEQFLTDKERGPDGQFGPEWGEVVELEEETWYFRLEQHKDWLLGFIDTHKDFVIPDFRLTELRNAVEKLSGDLSISRPKSRLSWGIELPFDRDFVTYVWFDALLNYITFAGYDPVSSWEKQPAEFRARWPAVQIIGKDILVPAHGIYWSIMLHALGFPDDVMQRLLVHGWWNVSGAKMSKSLGNVIDPDVLADTYGAEVLRYYLMSDIATGRDADFDEDRLRDLYRTDLANSLGNLLNRALSMAGKFRNGRLDRSFETDTFFQKPDGWWNSEEALNDGYDGQRASVAAQLRTVAALANVIVAGLRDVLRRFEIHSILGRLNHFSSQNNVLVEIAAPWKLAKDANRRADLDAVLYHLIESLRIIAILISPVLPKAAHGIFDQLNWKMEPELLGKEARFSLADARWGGLPDGHTVGKPTPLFPQFEMKVATAD